MFADIIIHQSSPLMLRQPKGLVAVEPSWAERIADLAFDRSIDLHTARIRANCCTWLVLIIGDTCQGKSTAIASILDEINKRRSGHIITIADPVETLILQRNCIITQREVGVDGDVESYHLGALDALRERTDVIETGEICDEQTAQEALALAESGPLVLATLHARSTEIGLQKMLRLLGNSDAQFQSLAHALRAVLCQALLPSVDANCHHLATECLTSSPDVAAWSSPAPPRPTRLPDQRERVRQLHDELVD